MSSVRKITKRELKKILSDHAKWLLDPKKGKRADLSWADLRGKDFSRANLSEAKLNGANLCGASFNGADLSYASLVGAFLRNATLIRADLIYTNLIGAHLSEANLIEANLNHADCCGANFVGATLRGANISEADLRRVDLSRADFSRANLKEANLDGANIKDTNFTEFNIVPEGDIIGYKKSVEGYIIKLAIPHTAIRLNSPAHRKCRTNIAKVLEITDLQGNSCPEAKSRYKSGFIYRVGEYVKSKVNTDIRIHCGEGIHFFITRQEAIDYVL